MKVIYGILFAVVYTIGYVFLAIMATGGGHGNFIAMIPVHPIWVINFAALFLLLFLEKKEIRSFFVAMMLVYYALLFFLLNEAAADKKMITHPHAGGLWIPAIWFLSGQLIIWILFFSKIKESKSDKNPYL